MRVLLPRYIDNNPTVYLFLKLEGRNSIIRGIQRNSIIKERKKLELLEFFLLPKNNNKIKKQTDFAWNFIEISIQNVLFCA